MNITKLGSPNTTRLCSPFSFFIGSKPSVLHIDDESYIVKNWHEVAHIILMDCNKTKHKEMQEICGKVSGKKRPIFHTKAEEMQRPLKIDEGMYFESHFGTEYLLTMTFYINDCVGYDHDKIYVTYRRREKI